MAGYIVTIKHRGKHYDIMVSDVEVMAKMAQFRKDCPQLANKVSYDDIAEMVAYAKAPVAVSVTKDSRQSWQAGPKCDICGAGHRMVTSAFNNGQLANALFGTSISMPKVHICEKCFETEYTTCSKCKRDLPNKEITDGLCSVCLNSDVPLKAKRVMVN